jgi:hypothetical protein
MSMDYKAIIFIGKSFRNEKDAIEFFQSKVEMTAKDLDEMGPHLNYWLEPRIKKGYPTCGLYNSWEDLSEEFYIGYDVFDNNPKKMIEKIEKSIILWENMFGEKAELIKDVLVT